MINAVFIPTTAYSQWGNSLSGTFDQYFQNYNLVNPASVDSSDKFSVRLGHVALTGLFEGVNRSYIDADFKPGERSNPSFSRLGIFIISNNDGAFISRNRYYGRYSRTISIGNDQFISAGLALGIVSYSFKGSQSIAGGTSNAFDANAGLWYIRKKLKIGFSIQQIPGSIVRPIQQGFQLNPYWNFNAVYTTYLGSRVLFSNHLYFSKENRTPVLFEYAPVLLFSDIIESGVNLKYNRGIAVMLGLRSIIPGYGKLQAMGSFLMSTKNLSSSADNKFEISAGYSF